MDKFISQHEIEKFVLDHFKEPGYFLEIGCWDGELISQTAFLERNYGWKGLCVDPFPINFEKRSCNVCRKAVSADGKNRRFLKVSKDRRHGGDVSYFSGFSDSVKVHLPLIHEFCDYQECEIETVTIEQLYGEYNLPSFIEFLSVDTEGSELEIFEHIDFEKYHFGLIVFEHNDVAAARYAIGNILQSHGYERIAALRCDDIYLGKNKQETMP